MPRVLSSSVLARYLCKPAVIRVLHIKHKELDKDHGKIDFGPITSMGRLSLQSHSFASLRDGFDTATVARKAQRSAHGLGSDFWQIVVNPADSCKCRVAGAQRFALRDSGVHTRDCGCSCAHASRYKRR
jgi:hypothetical protein